MTILVLSSVCIFLYDKQMQLRAVFEGEEEKYDSIMQLTLINDDLLEIDLQWRQRKESG